MRSDSQISPPKRTALQQQHYYNIQQHSSVNLVCDTMKSHLPEFIRVSLMQLTFLTLLPENYMSTTLSLCPRSAAEYMHRDSQVFTSQLI